ncbi:MAG: PHB depolymerase family esterase [Oligoflexia bacterium]|nr:PHB depolymerase family esterase [Oligoflexia bacterium]
MKLIVTLLLIIQFNLSASEIIEIEAKYDNPGNLRIKKMIPAKLNRNSALVVVLHGCTQEADSYAINSGWVKLAKEKRFALLIPEQKSGNNPFRCFNWFDSQDQAKTGGEAHSIYNMITQTIEDHKINPNRVYVTGFSAGGAMSAVMMATYPQTFRAGAINAGIPYNCTRSATGAFMCMNGFTTNTGEQWGDKIKTINPKYRGKYPRVSIWHGDNDGTVSVKNANELFKQWRNVLGLDESRLNTAEFNTHNETFISKNNRKILQMNIFPNMGHSTSIDPENGCGVDGRWETNTGLCSAMKIAQFFDLL